ncbi:MAG: 50S ribosomal protein L18 [Nanoarchaeota archaeon]
MRAKKRRREGKTDYKARMEMLKARKPRIIFRKTSRYIIGQYVKSEDAKDKVMINLTSKELLKYGWPESSRGSLKSLPACYLAGFLLGKKILEEKPEEAILDIGLLKSIKGSRIYAFLKGVVDAGVKIKVKEKMFPDESRLRGRHIRNNIAEIFNKVKEKIERS